STIPFKDELEHVQAYLAIEETRFEDLLTVEFDTPNINFRIPPLTLQPIVENSVKYGVDPELAPMHIKISSVETDDNNVITVTDTGPGFDESSPMQDDNKEPHVALKNIRERLDVMSGGTISISKRAEGGTKVTIIIPKPYNIGKPGDL
ncbi:MAG: sensor histidine kinase, partial [Lachnospiraceae bacterium]|nr:sensor histidine kinase [Lachnospiraceae bacterium]